MKTSTNGSSSGGKRWTMSAQSHAHDKKSLLSHTETLAGVTRKLLVSSSGSPDEELYIQLSSSLGTISALQIPYRQPSWGKEIASCVAVIGTLESMHYSPQDFASISRFITRSSSEKQLLLEGPTAVDMCKLMLSFLRDSGSSCRLDKQSGFAMAGSMVLHEVMRGTVQLLIDCAESLQDLRLDALQILMQFCDPKALDAETRYAAVDAVGTILLSLATYEESDKEDTHMNRLFELSEISVQMLLENLRNSTNILSRHGGEGMDGIPSKLLVSILRALSQSMAAYANNNPSKLSMRFTSLFQPHFQSIVQSLHMLFERVLPAIDKRTPTTKDFSSSTFALSHNNHNSQSSKRNVSSSRGRDSRSSTMAANGGGSMSTSISATSPVTKMWIGSLKLLGALAAFNPGAFMGSWQLFLTNSLAVDSDTTQAVNLMIKACRAEEYSHIVKHIYKKDISSSQMKSPIYSALLLAVNPTVRSEAARALRLMIRIDPKYLKKWIRLQSNSYVLILGEASLNKLDIYEKKTNMILKMMQMLAISVSREREESVLVEIFQTIKYLIDIFPMASLNEGIVKFAPIEDLVECIFRLVIKISLEFTLEEGEAISKTHVSFYAIDWLAEMCRCASPPRSLLRAIGCNLYSKNIYVVLNPQSWRKPPSSPQRNDTEGITYIHTIANLTLHEPEDAVLAHLVNAIQAMVHTYSKAKFAEELNTTWFHSYLTQCRNSPIQQMRLMAARIIDIVVSSDLALENRSPVSVDMYVLGDGFGNSSVLPNPILLNGRKSMFLYSSTFIFKLSEILDILNAMCNDIDHQVRSQALSSLGNALIIIGGTTSTLRKEVFQECLKNLISGTRDSIGTVREAAYKSLGEFLLVAGRTQAAGMLDLVSVDACKIEEELFQCIRTGCFDSKLTTRTNALGTLSSFLLYSTRLCSTSEQLAILDQIIHASLEVAVLMLTSESNNDKLFPNAVHVLAIVSFSLHLLLSCSQVAKIIKSLKDVLRVVIYEILLEDKLRYSQLASLGHQSELLKLSAEDRNKYLTRVIDCSNKTQYHIKQRLLLSITQTIGLCSSTILIALKMISIEQNGREELKSLLTLSGNLLLPLFQHGAFETPLLAGKALLQRFIDDAQHTEVLLNYNDRIQIYESALHKCVDKSHVGELDGILLALLFMHICICKNSTYTDVFIEFFNSPAESIAFVDWLKNFAQGHDDLDVKFLSLSAYPLPLTIDTDYLDKVMAKFPSWKNVACEIGERLVYRLEEHTKENSAVDEMKCRFHDAVICIHEAMQKLNSGRSLRNCNSEGDLTACVNSSESSPEKMTRLRNNSGEDLAVLVENNLFSEQAPSEFHLSLESRNDMECLNTNLNSEEDMIDTESLVEEEEEI